MYSPMQQGRLLCSLARPCRFVARRRYPAVIASPLRRFHLSRTWRSSTPSDPNDPRNSASDKATTGSTPPNGNHGLDKASVETPAERPVDKESGPYGSAVRRALRNKKRSAKSTSTPVTVPDWFLERNTLLHDRKDDHTDGLRKQVQICTAQNRASEDSARPSFRYALSEATWMELYISARAGLRLPPAKYATEPSARKSHLVLHCPANSSTVFLDAVIQKLALELNADLVTFDAQDIAQLCAEQDLAETGKMSSIQFLGYEVYRPSIPDESSDGLNESDEAEPDIELPRGLDSGGDKGPKFITIESSREPGDIPIPNIMNLRSLVAAIGSPSDAAGAAGSRSPFDRVEERRLQLLHKILSFSSKPTQKSIASDSSQDTTNESRNSQPEKPRDIIVQVQDYGDIQNTREGSKFITLLQKVIEGRRKDGHRVLLVGTAAYDPSLTETSALLQRSSDEQFSQAVLVIPEPMPGANLAQQFKLDRLGRTSSINKRHIQSMLRTRLEDDPTAVEDQVLKKDPHSWTSSLLASGKYYSYNQVHWLVTLALGSVDEGEVFGVQHLDYASMRILAQKSTERSRKDSFKRQVLETPTADTKASETEPNQEQLLASLRKTCNKYEKKLLNGVVDAKSIRTTFADVHVPSETIDALKTLTSLSLIRPEAFTYGVLATDKIPGLLLYGPPGTGKTMLAKAVARESGATVLEVSGSDVYDMYVGEGEKNVKAIFSLARKLNPCVVFIDEADAIFGARTGGRSRTSHRELINQFLREWDGMNDLSTFIMVATNRPFDLDDAVLRRLPRRLLVDLPTEQDRLAILKIHLKDETMESSVDLAGLARRTPFYSGSDLKNLCVAAALSCVREENALAQQHTGEEPYKYPARRTLTREHFERGIGEISASISEDMSSLSALRKFDEQYGDRKGRRKKSPGWGFMTPVADEAGASDAARVRT
ncbi:spastin [Aspergillus carlsbadensis]|nr:spastin [Aspergillus carlsbadensis]